MDEITSVNDLSILIGDYMRHPSLSIAQIEGIVQFYLKARVSSHTMLVDGTGSKPHYR